MAAPRYVRSNKTFTISDVVSLKFVIFNYKVIFAIWQLSHSFFSLCMQYYFECNLSNKFSFPFCTDTFTLTPPCTLLIISLTVTLLTGIFNSLIKQKIMACFFFWTPLSLLLIAASACNLRMFNSSNFSFCCPDKGLSLKCQRHKTTFWLSWA